MNSIKENILQFLDNKKPDYSILISGYWGVGKTHYIRETIIPDLNNIKQTDSKGKDKKKYKCIYLSLYGISSVEQIIRRVFYSSISAGISPLYVDSLFNVTTNTPKIGEYAKGLQKGLESVEKIAFKYLKTENCVIFLDDLERLDKSLSASDFLGSLFNIMVDSMGMHVIYIGNESVINKNDLKFKEVKEKVIRRTLEFSPDLKDQINQYINRYCQDITKIREYLTSRLEDLVSYYNAADTTNLRTIGFIIDHLKNISKVKDDELGEIWYDRIFDQIVMFSIEYTHGRFSKEERDDYENIYRMEALLKDKESVSDHLNAKLFFQKYIVGSKYRFIFLENIFILVHNGFCDISCLLEELKAKNPKEESETQKAMNKLTDCYRLEEVDLIKYVKIVFDSCKKGSYQIMIYPYLFSLLNFVISNYLDGKDFEDTYQVIDKAIDITDVPNDIKDDIFLPPITPYDIRDEKNPLFICLRDKVIIKLKKKKERLFSSKVEQFIKRLDSFDQPQFASEYHAIRGEKIFETIYKEKIVYYFPSLSNKSIYWIKVVLYGCFDSISNAGEHNYSEKIYLEKIADVIKDEIMPTLDSKMRKKIFDDLYNSFKYSANHLENTKQKS